MCLDTITRKYAKPSAKVVTAWKVFDKSDDLTFEFSPLRGSWVVPRGKWIESEACIALSVSTDSDYVPGFHAFAYRKDAEAWQDPWQVIVRVRLKYVTTVGTQRQRGRLKVYVARQMFVPKGRRARGVAKGCGA